jgi:SEC-C motif
MAVIGRNDPCPCGSGLKYKKCCLDKQQWEKIFRQPLSYQLRHLSLRGKNLFFVSEILAALQIDTWTSDIDFASIKKAFTPTVVKKIHESLLQTWPDLEDYERCHLEDRKNISGLYIGSYHPEAVFQAVTRHALYSEKIYLVDPFLHPQRIREEFNPLVHPEEHRSNTIKFAFLWLSLLPWIEAGIVSFIRPPIDFVPGLGQEVNQLNRKHFDSPELKAVKEKEINEEVSRSGPTDKGISEYFCLSHSDEWFLAEYERRPPPKDLFPTAEAFLRYIQLRRDAHPYFVQKLPEQTSEFIYETSGANYELAKRICLISGSHIITSYKTWWKQIELDRKNANIDPTGWTPFAKALQNSDLKVLNNISLDAALNLRKENRLESLRLFFHRVWKSCRDSEEFSEANTKHLTAELDANIQEAKAEWDKIDHELVKWFGASGAALLSTGVVGFVPAALGSITTGATGLILAQMKRASFKEQFPAGFFLKLKSEEN